MAGETTPPEGIAPLVRRLATILCADIAGYSQKMGADEERTVQTFRGHREIFESLVNLHQGRIFNTAGDALLAEFNSAVEAVRCATEIQTALRTRNEHLPPEQRLLFRIGINLGDVIVQGSDLLGDGVNVAARIQTIAEPGGICLSGSVYDQIRNKLSLQFRQLGERSFKNIAEPIRTFSITDTGEGTLPSISTWRRYTKQRLIAAGVSAIVLIATAGGYWAYRTHDAQRIRSEGARIAAEKEDGRAAADEARMTMEAQRKAEMERAARDVAEREAKLRAELLTAQRKAEQERAAKEAVQREGKLQVEKERIAREAAEREAKLQVEQERTTRETAQREAKLQTEQERIAREAAQREAKLQADLKAAQAELQQAEMAKKQAIQQAASIAAARQKASSFASNGPDRYDGTYQGRLCTQDDVGASTQKCRPRAVTVKQGAISGSWLAGGSDKRGYFKGTIGPDGAVKIALEGFNRKGKPITGSMTGTWSDATISASGTWHHNGIQVKATWKREP